MSQEITAAVLNTAPGRLELEKLYIDDPEAQEVRIRVEYAGLCHSDLHEIDGTFETQVPILLGHEAVGIIDMVGEAVDQFTPGDRVVTCLSAFCGHCRYCTSGHLVLCINRAGLSHNRSRPRLLKASGQPVRPTAGMGAFAEAMLVHQNAVVAVPAHVRSDTASILGCAVTTGIGAVIRGAQVTAGSTVAVIGTGGIGIAAIQGARLAGARRVIAIDIVPEKLNAARNFGATDVVNALEVPAVEQVIALTGGGVDFSFEAVGSAATVEQAFAMLVPRGVATVIGMVPGNQPIRIGGAELFLQEKRLQGSFMGSNQFKTDIPEYIELNEQGKLALDEMVTSRVDLADINDGFDQLARGADIRIVARIS
jgi:S-(hydroxymethyl)glutathione dehydrogenase/alcohol dehydrogenase